MKKSAAVSRIFRFSVIKPMFLFVCFFTLLFIMAPGRASIALAVEPDAFWVNNETGYRVYYQDSEGLLSPEEKEQLIEQMKEITAYANAAFESCRSTNTQTPKEYAALSYGTVLEEDTTLFLIDMDDRVISLFNSGKAKRAISASRATSITDNVYTYASDGDYYQCASRAFAQAATLLRGGRIAEPMRYICCILLGLILGLLINYFLVRILARNAVTKDAAIMEAIGAAAVITGGSVLVKERTRIRSSSDHSGSSGSFGGSSGGGSSFSGGSHRF